MKLKENQLKLIRHLAQFEVLEYASCLRLLDTEKTNDLVALSYAFRPLTKNQYLKKRKDGMIFILAKGRALFPEIKPLVTIGGGSQGIRRVNMVSRTAMFMREAGIESFESLDMTDHYCFIPSACWRKIRDGILSTTKFSGILFIGEHRLAVYDISDGEMSWQMRAERTLFYRNSGDYETKATGMLLICDDDKRVEIAQKIIRTTMWKRRQIIDKNSLSERDRPIKYVHAPICLAKYYERVYLTTPAMLRSSIEEIVGEKDYIKQCQGNSSRCYEPKDGDYEDWPYRYFINIATDLLKYVYYFAAAKSLMEFRKKHSSELNYAILLPGHDFPILRMYMDVINMEGMKFYEYKP